jgi:predicted regulator of Ras-like GTPase activity (Roadblock/LC7/MglB family)
MVKDSNIMLSKLATIQLEQRLSKLIEQCSAVDAAVVATLDGYTCAMKQRSQQYPLERLATMGSTLMSLGDTITAELRLGTCDNIISENKNGIVAFMHIDDNLVLITLTTQKNALGMLLSHSRRCAEELKKVIA